MTNSGRFPREYLGGKYIHLKGKLMRASATAKDRGGEIFHRNFILPTHNGWLKQTEMKLVKITTWAPTWPKTF